MADSPAKRRDCLSVMCGLPITVAGRRNQEAAGLIDLTHATNRKKPELWWLTRSGRILAMRALLTVGWGVDKCAMATIAQMEEAASKEGRRGQEG